MKNTMIIVAACLFTSLFMGQILSHPTAFALELLSTGQITSDDIDSYGVSFRSTGT